MPVWILRFANLLRKKIFTTIEINMCNTSKESMIANFDGQSKMKEYFNLIPNIYGISSYLINDSNCGVKLYSFPLYLGVENEFFTSSVSSSLSNIVFMGSLIKRKNIDEILDLAVDFKDLTFHIIGDGFMRDELEKDSSSNVIFYGKLTHDKISDVLQNIDLHILLSRSEGFPKVILETASAGIPSIVYGDYGAEEWITNNVNGFVLSRKEDVIEKIKELMLNPEMLILNSKEAVKLADKFSWDKLIKKWEKEILKLK